MLMDRINVAEWFYAKSPSFARCKEGDLHLLNFSNLTCMYLQKNLRLKVISSQDISPDYVYQLQGGTSQNLFTFQVCLFCKYSFIYLVLLRFCNRFKFW